MHCVPKQGGVETGAVLLVSFLMNECGSPRLSQPSLSRRAIAILEHSPTVCSSLRRIWKVVGERDSERKENLKL